MNKYTLHAFCGLFWLILGANSIFSAENFHYNGIKELNYPYSYFLKIADFENIYELNEKSRDTKSLSENFLKTISDRKYKEAEKWLLENYEHPYYLLNLIFLYIYFNREEYASLFEQWQKSTSNQRMANFINSLSTRNFTPVLEALSGKWLNPSLHYYSNYKLFKEKKQVNLILENFVRWKKLIPLDEFSKKLYGQAKLEWINDQKPLLPKFDDAPPEIVAPNPYDFSGVLTENQVKILEENLANARFKENLLYETLNHYLLYLKQSGQWKKMRTLVETLSWIPAEEKKWLFEKFSEWEHPQIAPVTVKENTIKIIVH